jgi:hypothetical protein
MFFVVKMIEQACKGVEEREELVRTLLSDHCHTQTPDRAAMARFIRLCENVLLVRGNLASPLPWHVRLV